MSARVPPLQHRSAVASLISPLVLTGSTILLSAALHALSAVDDLHLTPAGARGERGQQPQSGRTTATSAHEVVALVRPDRGKKRTRAIVQRSLKPHFLVNTARV